MLWTSILVCLSLLRKALVTTHTITLTCVLRSTYLNVPSATALQSTAVQPCPYIILSWLVSHTGILLTIIRVLSWYVNLRHVSTIVLGLGNSIIDLVYDSSLSAVTRLASNILVSFAPCYSSKLSLFFFNGLLLLFYIALWANLLDFEISFKSASEFEC